MVIRPYGKNIEDRYEGKQHDRRTFDISYLTTIQTGNVLCLFPGKVIPPPFPLRSLAESDQEKGVRGDAEECHL